MQDSYPMDPQVLSGASSVVARLLLQQLLPIRIKVGIRSSELCVAHLLVVRVGSYVVGFGMLL